MYQALYRKYRPRTFDDVIGQEHITAALKNQIIAGKMSHAYLFCGTRGTGKTTCSKILAKAVNCPSTRDGNPCCECEICTGIDSLSNLDVTEIDAASNSGVDNIRSLREEANFMPATGKYRVYIIDETHMLSTGAFNALLKIMEEPPAHVIFILATTEIHKVPATILSRCQRFNFKRITPEEIAKRLLYIAEKEDINLDEDSALLIAKLSDGAVRDALSLLDLCISGTNELSLDIIRQCAGIMSGESLFELARAINANDIDALFNSLNKIWEDSADAAGLCRQLITFYRNVMVAKTARDCTNLLDCFPHEVEAFKAAAGEMPLESILAFMDILGDCLSKMSRTAEKKNELEMALIKLAGFKPKEAKPPVKSGTENDVLQRIEKLESKISRIGSSGAAVKEKPEPLIKEGEIEKTKVEPFDNESWKAVLERLKTKNTALYGALAGSKAYTGEDLFLIDAGTLFADIVRSDNFAKKCLREVLEEVTGQKYRLGPFNSNKYEVKRNEDTIKNLIADAEKLGVDVEIT